ncbi:MAG TPA: SDR family NAD(P)-dependent oxidoreductase, partial [Bdellovibrionales bacterium]|nr:SDR family NAD(P)-dependent oxidoreductase [Bdellovibrionales bacterium]
MKKALITGATAGIGRATAEKLARAGVHVVAVGRRADRLAELSRELAATGLFDTLALDVSDRAACERAFREHSRLFEGLDILVNNAGLAKGLDLVQDADPAHWDEMIDVNIKGLLYLTRLVLPGMLKQGRGHIVNVGSVAGRWVYPRGAVYCATKFAVRALSEELRFDLLGTPIRVTNIEPGMVETE